MNALGQIKMKVTREQQDHRAEYGRALAEFLRDPGREEASLWAYEIGRRALADGIGLLELAMTHHEMFAHIMVGSTAAETAQAVSAAKLFFIEALAPFEMSRQL